MVLPEITVATIIEKDGKFLLVEENTERGILLNQPAGHLEFDETIEEAARREALEETACKVELDALVGVYLIQYETPKRKVSFIRFTFAGRVIEETGRPLDPDILRLVWMTPEELRACPERHRSNLVLKSVEDYVSGKRAPLSVLSAGFLKGN